MVRPPRAVLGVAEGTPEETLDALDALDDLDRAVACARSNRVAPPRSR